MRYVGQEHTVRVALGGRRVDGDALRDWAERFRIAHERQYRLRLDRPVELVTFHLAALGGTTRPAFERSTARTPRVEGKPRALRRIDLDGSHDHETPIHDRLDLEPGMMLEGPVAIEETGTVTLIAAGQRTTVDPFGNLVIRVPRADRGAGDGDG